VFEFFAPTVEGKRPARCNSMYFSFFTFGDVLFPIILLFVWACRFPFCAAVCLNTRNAGNNAIWIFSECYIEFWLFSRPGVGGRFRVVIFIYIFLIGF
jgi:hypothetical protein